MTDEGLMGILLTEIKLLQIEDKLNTINQQMSAVINTIRELDERLRQAEKEARLSLNSVWKD